MARRFRKKPVVIEAIQFNGHNFAEIGEFVGDAGFSGGSHITATLQIRTLEGKMTALQGDWIIKGVAGEFYPCNLDIFEMTYEAAD